MYYNDLLIGQRVIVNREIGTVQKPTVNTKAGVRVFLPSVGYASDFDRGNVKELPGGQL